MFSSFSPTSLTTLSHLLYGFLLFSTSYEHSLPLPYVSQKETRGRLLPMRSGILNCQHLVKNLPAMQETLVQFLGREDPLEKG